MIHGIFNRAKLSAALGAAAMGLILAASVPAAFAQGDSKDAKMEADIHKTLDHKRFNGVQAAVQNGVVVLTGTVENFADKEDADHRVHHVDHVKGVDNEIQVGGGGTAASVSDEALRDKLSKALTYDRVGYGTTAFNSINIGVQNGVVTLSGTVYGPTDKSSALSLVSHTPGVRDVVDNLEVAPTSPMDDQLRVRLARAIYGDPVLSRYSLDPAKPIRITVVNGNVVLTGVVSNEMEKNIAGIKANSVPGVFKVTNDLQVEGEQHGAK
jgi:hyperosmotically inducible periplasmic protein